MASVVKRLFLILWAFAALGSSVQAATIVYASKKYVIIDAGSENGLQKGHKVCFFDSSMSMLGCGSIKAIRLRLAGVPVAKELSTELSVGMAAKSEFLIESEGTPKATKKEIAKFVKALKKAEINLKAKEETTEEPESTPGFRAVGMNYLFSALMPFSFKTVAYELQNEIARTGSLWTGERLVSRSPLGAELFWNPSIATGWAGDFRLYYRYLPDDGLIVNYDVRDPKVGLRGVLKGSSAGLFLGVARLWGAEGTLSFRSGGGLDVDNSQIQFSANPVDSAETETVATLSSQLSVLSFRLDGGLRLRWRSLGVDLGLGALLPLSGTAKTSAKVPGIRTSVTQDQLDSAGEDLQKAVAHQRAKFGFQVTLGLSALY